MTSQFRSERGKTRKREISRDFSRFFDPEFFLSFIYPFCPFRCCLRTRTHEKGFFAYSESNRLCGWIRTCESGAGRCEKAAASQIVYKHIWSLLKLSGFELTKLGNRQSDELFLFQQIKTNKIPLPYCLDSNPRKRKICLLSVCFLDFPRLVWYCVWLQEAMKMKKMIDELWDGEISPQDTLISDNREYREL